MDGRLWTNIRIVLNGIRLLTACGLAHIKLNYNWLLYIGLTTCFFRYLNGFGYRVQPSSVDVDLSTPDVPCIAKLGGIFPEIGRRRLSQLSLVGKSP